MCHASGVTGRSVRDGSARIEETAVALRVYTRRGDDGTTALRGGGRVPKSDVRIDLVGTLDEAQAFLGLARAEAGADSELGDVLVGLERDLWILMAEVAADAPSEAGTDSAGTAVDASMVQALEVEMDRRLDAGDFPTAFTVPGENRLSACLDVARTVVRRAERLASPEVLPSEVARAYLNRLSDLCWVLARSSEVEHRTNRRPPRSAP